MIGRGCGCDISYSGYGCREGSFHSGGLQRVEVRIWRKLGGLPKLTVRDVVRKF